MNVGSIRNIPEVIINNCTNIGKNADNAIRKLPNEVENIIGEEKFNNCKVHYNSMKGKFDEFTSSEYITNLKGKVNKHTILGAIIVAGVSVIVIKTLTSIKKELERIKNK